MQLLKERIIKEGKNLGNGILKVDSFVNHQVDPILMDACGRDFAEFFKDSGAQRVLTAEISGIAPALMTAKYLNLPVVYARKNKPITMPDEWRAAIHRLEGGQPAEKSYSPTAGPHARSDSVLG